MATNRNAIPTQWFGRAAFAWLVCAQLLFCGCRSPWRSWRNDEPSLEQLLMQPGPWDAEARLAQESPTHRSGEPQSGDKSYGRSNPYAARDAVAHDSASGRTAAAQADGARAGDQAADRAAQAEFEAAYAAAPPHLRGLLKRQWDATQARNTGRSGGRSDADSYDSADAGATSASAADSGDEAYAREDPRPKSAVARRTRSGERSASASLSDDQSSQEEAAAPSDAVAADAAQSSAMPHVKKHELVAKQRASKDTESDDTTIRELKPQTPRRSSAEGAVTYSLKDTDEGSSDADEGLEELAPPPSKKASRQVAHAEPVDTGAGDEVLVKPAVAAVAQQTQTQRTETQRTGAERAAAQPASYTATAAAEAPVTPAAATTGGVVLAAAAEPTAAEAKEMKWRDHLREALRELEEQPENSTENPAEQLHRQAASRMLRVALGELEPALRPIEGLQTHEQEFFRHEFQALHDAIDPKGNPVLSRRWTLALDSHRKALGHLAAVSNLEIKNANFCTDVHSYGVINKFSNPHFKPNQELLLYCELDNFAAEAVKDGYETQLQGSYEIVDAGGRRVADMLLPEDADICRNERRDYFIAYRVYMPQKIEPGRYQLRLTIEDMKGRKFGQTSLDFQIKP